MERWLNISTLTGLMFGLVFGVVMTSMLGPIFGIPMGLMSAFMWAMILNSSRTAGGGDKTDKDAD